MKNNTTAGFEPTRKNAKGIRTLMQSLVTTSQNDNGATARRQYVSFGEFISGQRSEFQIFEIAISIASFQNPPRSIVSASKNNVCMFFYIQIQISEYC
jgi:hypothetical protein